MAKPVTTVQIDVVGVPEFRQLLVRVAEQAYEAGFARGWYAGGPEPDESTMRAAFSDWLIHGPGAQILG
jgi:hypothetical protein